MYRPQYHFSPPRNFMNDPNGLVYFDGEYHLFYQHNPFENKWGHMSWGHAVSRDLVHWQNLPTAFGEHDGIMAFSGSAVVDCNNTSGFARGSAPLVAIYTGHVVADQYENQCLAYSNDRGRTWTRYADNPVLDLKSRDFRDPKVFWYAPSQQWIMCVSKADQRKVLIYGSKDLKTWNLLSEFGPAGVPDKPNWECPDLFPLPMEGESGTKWVLHAGMGAGAVAGGSGGEYFIGNFDGVQFHCDDPAQKSHPADFGKDFYAAVSYSDIPKQDGRRIWIGWMNNWQYANELPTHPWRGQMTIPRALSLKRTTSGLRMIQTPIHELQRLRGKHDTYADLKLDSASPVPPIEAIGDCLEIIADFTVQSAHEIGINVRKGEDEQTLIGYDSFHQQLFLDRTQSGEVAFSNQFPGRHVGPLEPDHGHVRLHIYVDRSSVEVFANSGQTVITDLIFPKPVSRGLELHVKDGAAVLNSLDVYELKSAWSQ